MEGVLSEVGNEICNTKLPISSKEFLAFRSNMEKKFGENLETIWKHSGKYSLENHSMKCNAFRKKLDSHLKESLDNELKDFDVKNIKKQKEKCVLFFERKVSEFREGIHSAETRQHISSDNYQNLLCTLTKDVTWTEQTGLDEDIWNKIYHDFRNLMVSKCLFFAM